MQNEGYYGSKKVEQVVDGHMEIRAYVITVSYVNAVGR